VTDVCERKILLCRMHLVDAISIAMSSDCNPQRIIVAITLAAPRIDIRKFIFDCGCEDDEEHTPFQMFIRLFRKAKSLEKRKKGVAD
jgi:hypothetical protein